MVPIQHTVPNNPMNEQSELATYRIKSVGLEYNSVSIDASIAKTPIETAKLIVITVCAPCKAFTNSFDKTLY